MTLRALFHFDSDAPFIDAVGHAVTVVGSPALSTVAGQFGTGVMQHDSGGYLQIASADMVVQSWESYTIQARVWVASGNSSSEQIFWIASDGWHMKLGIFRLANDPYWYVAASNGGVGALLSSTPLALFDQPVHIAVCRNGSGIINFWVGGTNHGTEPTNAVETDAYLFIGATGAEHSIKFEEVCFHVNEQLYTAPFSVPTAAFLPANPAQLVPETITLPLAVAVGDLAVLALPGWVTVGEFGTATLPIALSVIPAGLLSGVESIGIGQGGDAAVWTAIVKIDDVDVTARVVGDIQVEANEGAARIANFTFRPANGTTVDLSSWTARAVTIEVADNSTGTPRYAQRLFTGVIDTTRLDMSSRLLAFDCTDDLQGRCDALNTTALAALIAGYASPVVFDATATGWSFAIDQLSTVPASLDISPVGELRLTPWQAKSVADIVLDADRAGDGSIQVSIADRAGLINSVTVEFDYRFPRVKAEMYSVEFTAVDMTGFAQWVLDRKYFLQRAQVNAAIEAAGATIASIIYTPLPTSIIAVGAGYFTPSAADLELCMGFSAAVTFDYAQTTEEQHRIAVVNAKSVDLVGTRASTVSGALEGAYPDLVAVESGIRLFRAEITKTPPQDMAVAVLNSTTSADASLSTETNRAAANAAMEALIAMAKVSIHASHRRNRVSVTVPLFTAIDLDKTLRIDADHVVAQGKCARVVHTLSPDTGVATSELQIAVCALAGTGYSHPEDATLAPTGSTAGSTALTGPVQVTFNAGENEDHVLAVVFPGVEDAERANAVIALPSTRAAAIAEDEFTITVES